MCAGSIDPSHRAVSHGSLLRQSLGTGSVGTDASNATGGPTKAQRRAVSACCLNRRTVTTGSHGKYALFITKPGGGDSGVVMVYTKMNTFIETFKDLNIHSLNLVVKVYSMCAGKRWVPCHESYGYILHIGSNSLSIFLLSPIHQYQ